MPIKPYVPYGFNDPETGELIQCEDYGVLLFDVLENETIAEIKYSDFIARVRSIFSSKVKGYDGNHIIIEGLNVDELKKLAE